MDKNPLMSVRRGNRSVAVAGALLLLSCDVAFATATPPVAVSPNPPAAAPIQGKTFGDWSTRCFPVNSGSPCDMFQTLINKQTKQRLMSVSIAYAPQRNQYLIQIAVPLEVALRKGLLIQTSTYRSVPLMYRRCADACMVEGAIDSASLSAISRATGRANVVVSDGAGHQIRLPLSLNGFAAAFDAMKALNEKRVH